MQGLAPGREWSPVSLDNPVGQKSQRRPKKVGFEVEGGLKRYCDTRTVEGGIYECAHDQGASSRAPYAVVDRDLGDVGYTVEAMRKVEISGGDVVFEQNDNPVGLYPVDECAFGGVSYRVLVLVLQVQEVGDVRRYAVADAPVPRSGIIWVQVVQGGRCWSHFVPPAVA